MVLFYQGDTDSTSIFHSWMGREYTNVLCLIFKSINCVILIKYVFPGLEPATSGFVALICGLYLCA